MRKRKKKRSGHSFNPIFFSIRKARIRKVLLFKKEKEKKKEPNLLGKLEEIFASLICRFFIMKRVRDVKNR